MSKELIFPLIAAVVADKGADVSDCTSILDALWDYIPGNVMINIMAMGSEFGIERIDTTICAIGKGYFPWKSIEMQPADDFEFCMFCSFAQVERIIAGID